jgi:hypothetical protein
VLFDVVLRNRCLALERRLTIGSRGGFYGLIHLTNFGFSFGVRELEEIAAVGREDEETATRTLERAAELGVRTRRLEVGRSARTWAIVVADC